MRSDLNQNRTINKIKFQFYYPDCVNCKMELWFFHQKTEQKNTENPKPSDGMKTARRTRPEILSLNFLFANAPEFQPILFDIQQSLIWPRANGFKIDG